MPRTKYIFYFTFFNGPSGSWFIIDQNNILHALSVNFLYITSKPVNVIINQNTCYFSFQSCMNYIHIYFLVQVMRQINTLALNKVFRVQLYKNNARALLSCILSTVNTDWLQHARSVRGVYEFLLFPHYSSPTWRKCVQCVINDNQALPNFFFSSQQFQRKKKVIEQKEK